MSNKTPEELARESMAKGTFSFVERLRGRGYPKDDVVVYLDDDLGYKIANLERAYEAALDADEQKKIKQQILDLRDQAEPSKLVFKMQGISSKRYDELVDEANENFPVEYEESTDLMGVKRKEEIPNPDRNEFFNVALWVEHILSIEDADGNQNTDTIDAALIKELRETAPLSAVARIAQTVDKLRVAVDWVDFLEDPDFLAKR